MRKLLVASLSAALLFTACKKPQPSPAYADASQKFATIYGAKLDEAYVDPQMDGILAQLHSVPADSLDAKSASDLAARIEAGRAQILKEREDRAAMTKAALTPSTAHFETTPVQQQQTPPPVEQKAAPDGGANMAMAPRPGMTAAEFEKSFGQCFEYGPTIQLQGAGAGPADSRTLRDLNACKDRLPGYESKMVLFQNGVVVNVLDKSSIQTVTRNADGGMVDGGS